MTVWLLRTTPGKSILGVFNSKELAEKALLLYKQRGLNIKMKDGSMLMGDANKLNYLIEEYSVWNTFKDVNIQ